MKQLNNGKKKKIQSPLVSKETAFAKLYRKKKKIGIRIFPYSTF